MLDDQRLLADVASSNQNVRAEIVGRQLQWLYMRTWWGRGVRSENSCVQAGVTTYASRLRTGNQSFVSKTVTITATPAIQTSRSGRIINTVLPSSTGGDRGRGSIIPVYYEGVEDDDDMSDEKETTDIPDVSSSTEEDQDADSTAAPPADTIQRKAAQLTRHPARTEAADQRCV